MYVEIFYVILDFHRKFFIHVLFLTADEPHGRDEALHDGRSTNDAWC